MRYILIAELGTTTNMVSFDAENDTDAELTAAFKVMRAAPESTLWARGEVTLKNEAGDIISRMPAKRDDL
jgi:hypothetical protein